MDRNRLQQLIESLESLERATQEASAAFDEPRAEGAKGGWWILDPEER